ncbi:MAG: PaaI family thioesterase [Deltaproteobacteria bacterium]|nr:PaaI family thioesterase [Deltaproteobacteria bacterium]MBF0526924.1 PaaI family thioesterase [Deltaproteobacteria bacterium]
MKEELHYRALETMYLAAPINEIFKPRITVSHERAEIEIKVDRALFHAAGAVHGSVYFKMLDDAAFFAANSIVPDRFVLTTSFVTYLTKPISSGRMKSIGRVVNKTRAQIIAESVVYDEHEEEIGRGNGVFVRSKLLLADALGYQDV